MHDIVRDVAISIAFDKYFVRAGVNLEEWPNMETLGSYNGISLMCNRIRNGLPVSQELLQNLQILLVQDNISLYWSYSHELFSRLKALTVLDMSNTNVTVQLPIPTNNCFGDMQDLRTLILNGIDFETWDTNFLENSKSLEVLSIRRCSFGMPINVIEKLTNLRLLDLTEINLDHIIPANVISQLSRLEELHTLGSEINEIVSSPIEVAGLQSLSRLKVLSMSLDSTQIGPEDFTFPDWETFLINLGVELSTWPESSNANYMSLEKIIVQAMMLWPKWVKRLFKRTNRLLLYRMKDLKNILPDLSFIGDNLNVLKQLSLAGAIEFEYLINTKEWSIPPMEHHPQVLSNLEKLELHQLDSFKGICHGSLPSISSGFLSKLECLDVFLCPKLSNALLPFNLLQRLPGLRLLSIGYCKSLEQVFDFEIEGLVDGHKGHEVQLLSSLRELELIDLPRLKHLFNFHGRIVQLDNLLVMRVYGCHSLKNLFRHFVARNLQKLKELSVADCEDLEEIVGKESGGQEEEEKVDKIVFASLQTLTLDSLSNLNGFCTGSSPFDWPSLENVEVQSCPKMITFATVSTTCGIQSMPKLKAIRLDDVEKTLEGEDLNTVIEKHFKEKEVLDLAQETETDNEEEKDLEEYDSNASSC